MITLKNFKNHGDFIVVETDTPFRTFSSAMHNPGYGEFTTFINRTVDINYNPQDAHEEMRQFLISKGYSLENTVALMTAVNMEFAHTGFFEDGETSIAILVTTGLGNAVDITRAHLYHRNYSIGTINIFIFINGHLTDEALIQAICSAVEVKTKVLYEREIFDFQSGTIATGTSTDSICIAATQQGEFHEYAGSITRIGTLIGKGLYETMNRSVDQYVAFKKGKL